MPYMDTCVYCGKEYPRMALWTRGKERIQVCTSLECRRKAKKAGYRRRG